MTLIRAAIPAAFLIFSVLGCLFGTQASASEIEVVEAEEILAEIRDGEAVERFQVRIEGDLDLRSLEGGVRSPVTIVDCEIAGPVRMEGAAFDGPVRFEETNFEEMALFSGARFNASADFSYSTFEDTVFFDSTQFGGDARFCATRFGRDAYFSNAVFSGISDFNFTRFAEEYVLFDGVRFCGPAHFEDAEFGRWTNFYGSRFSEEADFLLATFPGRSFIANVTFEGDAKFAGVEFDSFAEFEDSRFEGDFLLYGSTISYMKLNGTVFGEGSQVHLNNTEIEGFVIPWRTMEDHLVFRDEVYMGLVENYKRLGWFQDADNCYYHYRKLSQERKPVGWSKAIDHLAWLSCGYGVRPDFTFAWSLSIILLFGSVFYLGGGLLQPEGPGEGALPFSAGSSEVKVAGEASPREGAAACGSAGPEPPGFGEAIYFSSLVFIAQAPAEYRARGRYRYLVIFEGILGWLMLALFLVGLGNLMIR